MDRKFEKNQRQVPVSNGFRWLWPPNYPSTSPDQYERAFNFGGDVILVNVEGPPLGNGASFMDDSVGPGHALVGIAEDRVVAMQRLGELLVVARDIHAGGEIGDVQPFQKVSPLGKRLAFGRAASRERLGEPGEHDGGLALVIGQRVNLAVGTGQRKRGCRLAHLGLVGEHSPGSPDDHETGSQQGCDRYHLAAHLDLLLHWKWMGTPMIGVGRTDWFRPLPPPNRAGGFPAHGSPVSGLV